jgi:transposase-like protein
MKPFNHSEPAGPASPPKACPACKSPSVTTAAKHPDVDTYWRCEQCGEVWNVSRRTGPAATSR